MNKFLEDVIDILVVMAICGFGVLLLFIGVGCARIVPLDGVRYQNMHTGCVSDLRGEPESWCE